LVLQLVMIALLVWIGLNVRAIRKAVETPATATSTIDTADTDDTAPVPAPAPQPVQAEKETPEGRLHRIAQALAAKPPQGIRVGAVVLDESTETLARAAVEVSLRLNGCFAKTEAIDGKLSAAEQKALRTCAELRDDRLVSGSGQIDAARAIAWLERTVSPAR